MRYVCCDVKKMTLLQELCITERRDMCLYEVSLCMSSLDFGVWYYVVVKSSFKHTPLESKMVYVF